MSDTNFEKCFAEISINQEAVKAIRDQSEWVREAINGGVSFDVIVEAGEAFKNGLRENILDSKSSCSGILK